MFTIDRHCRIAHRQAADLLGGIQIALHGRRRDKQQVGDVVEAAAGVVGRQQQRIIHLLGQRVERQQIADGVLILGAAQAMQQRQLAGIRLCGGCPVELGLEDRTPPNRTVAASGRGAPAGGIASFAACGLLSPRAPRWRLRDNSGGVEYKSGGFEFGVVAGDTVLSQDRAGRGR